MALTFPRSVASFWGELRLTEFSFVLEAYQAVSGTRGGEILTSAVAEPKWRIEASVVTMTLSEAEIWRARINALVMRGSDGTFLACDTRRAGPLFDRDGDAIEGFAPTVLGVSGRRGLRFTGLPAGYQITTGDYLSVAYGVNPVRYAYMQAAETVVANGDGQTSFIDVTPFVKTGVIAGRPVEFVNAPVKMMIREFDPGSTGLLHVTGMRLTAIEAF